MTEPSGREAVLEACPFCGGRKIDVRDFRCRCNDCGAFSTWQPHQEAAIAAWNRRTTPSPLLGNRSGSSGNHIEAVRAGADAPNEAWTSPLDGAFRLGDTWPDWFAVLHAHNIVVTGNIDGRHRGGPDYAEIKRPDGSTLVKKRGNLIRPSDFFAPVPPAADAAPLAAGPQASQLGDSGPSHEDLLSERSALEERVRELEAIAGLARELVSPAGMVNRGVDRGLVVIERADKSDPHYRLCTALAQLSTSLLETGEGS